MHDKIRLRLIATESIPLMKFRCHPDAAGAAGVHVSSLLRCLSTPALSHAPAPSEGEAVSEGPKLMKHQLRAGPTTFYRSEKSLLWIMKADILQIIQVEFRRSGPIKAP